jgi:hypothetical protein
MSKFVYVYHGGMHGATKEEQDKIMAAWGQWFGKLGDALVDGGNPLGAPKIVTANDVSDKADNPASGFSIVNAKDQAEATEMAKGCPIFSNSPGAFVEVYEAFPM